MQASSKLLVIVMLLLFSTCSCFTHPGQRGLKSVDGTRNDQSRRAFDVSRAPTILVSTVAAGSTDVVAKLLGYVMGIGSMSVYTPIIINLLKSKSADGYSIQTWIFNVLGLTMAAVYPYQKKFPISSYLELVILATQSIGILGLICHFKGEHLKGLCGLAIYGVVATFLLTQQIPLNVLNSLQLVATLVCNYANVPQILLTFREKRAAWSRITAAMSVGGNLIRVFTSITLTKDYLFLFGYLLGGLTNGILLAQTFLYPSVKK